MLGLITTKKPHHETPELLRLGVSEAARYVPMERLALSPQCGFASSIIGNKLSAEDQRRKLELLVHAARLLWG